MSVVVATHDRPARLARLLAGLRVQSLGSGRFEVVVVADGCGADTLELLAREQARGGLALRVAEQPVARGPAAARNAGWRRARAPLVAFTDDDCVPAPGWLAAGLAQAGHAAVVQGRTEPDPGERSQVGLLSRTHRVERLGPQFQTCNMFYPRAVLEQLGGFHEEFGLTPGGEDTDLAWRAIAAGHATRFAPEALVYHAVEPLGARASLRVAGRWSATVRVFADHPGARSMLYRGLFWNVWHYLLWRSVLALLAPRWLRRLLLARHLAELRKRAREAGAGRWAVPFLLAHDAVECCAVARGALRYRTPVL